MSTKMTRFLLSSVLASALVLSPAALAGESPTFYKDVLPIVQENCQSCHRSEGINMGGMVAPMAFVDYAGTRPWAKSIARVVADRVMPPWHATAEFNGVFRNERTLTEDEIATLVEWVRTGAAEGDQADAPEPIVWANAEWRLGEPDLIVSLPEPFWVADEVEDQYQNIPVTITNEMLPVPRYIRASEARGGSKVVHHIVARPIGGMAPGGGHQEFIEGYGTLLEPGTVVNFNMHYHKEPGEGTGTWDQSRVALWFHTTPVYHPVRSTAIGNWTFEVPPGEADWRVGASMILDEDTTLLSMTPHMHLRGSAGKYTAFYPDGTVEVLLDVPAYDFNWQTAYTYAEPKLLPAGTRLQYEAHFDNSDTNLANPDSSQAVRYGGPTTSEMMLGFMRIAPTKPILPTEVPSAGGAGQ